MGRVESFFKPNKRTGMSPIEEMVGEEITPQNTMIYICGYQGTIDGVMESIGSKGFITEHEKDADGNYSIKYEFLWIDGLVDDDDDDDAIFMMQPPSVESTCGLAVRIRHNANRHAATAPASNGDMNFYIQGHLHKIMTALACIDYGFEWRLCDTGGRREDSGGV